MTDAEIIKALEHCEKGFVNCDGCPYDDDNNYCVTKDGKSLIIQDALDLIKRQKAEIERLRKVADLPSEGFFNLLCGALVYTKTLEEYNNFRKMIKTEAIKEFAERLCDGRVSNDPVVIAVKTELQSTMSQVK